MVELLSIGFVLYDFHFFRARTCTLCVFFTLSAGSLRVEVVFMFILSRIAILSFA